MVPPHLTTSPLLAADFNRDGKVDLAVSAGDKLILGFTYAMTQVAWAKHSIRLISPYPGIDKSCGTCFLRSCSKSRDEAAHGPLKRHDCQAALGQWGGHRKSVRALHDRAGSGLGQN